MRGIARKPALVPEPRACRQKDAQGRIVHFRHLAWLNAGIIGVWHDWMTSELS
jgi:hypothetical protein